MGSKFHRLQWCSFFLQLLFGVSCSLNLELKEPEGEKEFFRETSRLEKIAREDPATSARAKSDLTLRPTRWGSDAIIGAEDYELKCAKREGHF